MHISPMFVHYRIFEPIFRKISVLIPEHHRKVQLPIIFFASFAPINDVLFIKEYKRYTQVLRNYCDYYCITLCLKMMELAG